MRDGAPDAILSTAAGWSCSVSSWKGATLLAASVPVTDGTFSAKDDQEVPERVTLTVPRYAEGFDWLPKSNTDHPLARFGQQLWIAVTVHSGTSSWQTRLGRFIIQSTAQSDDGGSIDVEAVGILQAAKDARLRHATSPASGATIASEFRRLMPGGIPVTFTASDRSCPTSFAWDEDRLGALYDLADACPARILTNGDGVVQVLPPLGATPTVVLTLTDGEGGVVMAAPQDDSRDGAYNVCVVRSADTDSTTHDGVLAVVETTAGPFGVATYGEVVRYYSSPLVTTGTQGVSAGTSLLATSQRRSRTQRVVMPPDPRVEIGDGVQLTYDGDTYEGWVIGVDGLSLVQKSSPSPMVLTVGLA